MSLTYLLYPDAAPGQLFSVMLDTGQTRLPGKP
jgi:hypothetical protein